MSVNSKTAGEVLPSDRTSTPTTLAEEWVILNSGCEELMTYDEWCERRKAAVAYADTFGEEERTEFWYALADHACTEPRLRPSPGLPMTPENMAREDRRLHDVVRSMYDGVSEHEPWDWLRFTDPMFYGFTIGENARYAHVRAGLPANPDQWSFAPPGYADTKLADLFPDEQD